MQHSNTWSKGKVWNLMWPVSCVAKLLKEVWGEAKLRITSSLGEKMFTDPTAAKDYIMEHLVAIRCWLSILWYQVNGLKILNTLLVNVCAKCESLLFLFVWIYTELNRCSYFWNYSLSDISIFPMVFPVMDNVSFEGLTGLHATYKIFWVKG